MFTIALSSGPFLLAPTAQALDWAVINDSKQSQTVRVTVYKWIPSDTKVPHAGPYTYPVPAGGMVHVGLDIPAPIIPGLTYEVVVETTSPNVLPNVTQWAAHDAGGYIPGTLIAAGSFARLTAEMA